MNKKEKKQNQILLLVVSIAIILLMFVEFVISFEFIGIFSFIPFVAKTFFILIIEKKMD